MQDHMSGHMSDTTHCSTPSSCVIKMPLTQELLLTIWGSGEGGGGERVSEKGGGERVNREEYGQRSRNIDNLQREVHTLSITPISIEQGYIYIDR